MADRKKELLTILRLDSVDFKTNLSSSQKSVFAFSATVAAAGVAVLAAARQTAQYQDETIKAARAVGLAVEDYSALRHAADLSGLSIDQLATSTRKLLQPTEQVETSLRGMGVSLRDANGNMRSQMDILKDMSKRYKQLEDPADRARLAFVAFGEDGTRMANLLAGDLEELTAQAEAMGLVVSEEAGRAAERLNDDLSVLSGSVQGLRNKVMESVIAFINKTGILEKLAKVVQRVTGWWSSLSDSTQTIIVGLGAAVVGVALVVTALLGLVAIAPLVTGAITAMTAGINLIVLAVIAAAAVVAAMVAKIAVDFDRFRDMFDPVIRSAEQVKLAFSELWEEAKKAGRGLEPIREAFNAVSQAFDDLIAGADDLDLVVTVIKAAIFPLVAAFITLGAAARSFAAVISSVIQNRGAIVDFLKEVALVAAAASQGLVGLGAWAATGGPERITNAWNRVGAAAGNTMDRIKQIHREAAADIQQSMSSIRTVVEDSTRGTQEGAARAREELERLAKEGANAARQSAGSAQKVTSEWVTAAEKIRSAINSFTVLDKEGSLSMGALVDSIHRVTRAAMEMAKKISSVASAIGDTLQSVADVQTEEIRRSVETQTHGLDVITRAYSKMMEDQIDAVETAENAKIAALKETAAAEMRILEEAKANKLRLMDEEFAEAAEKREMEFQRRMEEERARFEADKESMMERTRIKEERRIVDEEMERGWLERQRMMEQKHKSDMATFSDEWNASRRSVEATEAEKIKKAEEAKNAAIEAAEKHKQDKLNALRTQQEEREKQSAKLRTFIEWQGERAALQIGKGAKIANTVAAGTAGAAQAFAALAPIPFVGPILGAAAAGVIIAMTARSVQQISQQQIPPPPSLFFRDGGFIRGPSHEGGGVRIGRGMEAEGGEMVIDRDRTRKFLAGLDDGIGGRRFQGTIEKIDVHIYDAGSPTPEFAREVGDQVYRQILEETTA